MGVDWFPFCGDRVKKRDCVCARIVPVRDIDWHVQMHILWAKVGLEKVTEQFILLLWLQSIYLAHMIQIFRNADQNVLGINHYDVRIKFPAFSLTSTTKISQCKCTRLPCFRRAETCCIPIFASKRQCTAAVAETRALISDVLIVVCAEFSCLFLPCSNAPMSIITFAIESTVLVAMMVVNAVFFLARVPSRIHRFISGPRWGCRCIHLTNLYLYKMSLLLFWAHKRPGHLGPQNLSG